jgi:hypothetical protein
MHAGKYLLVAVRSETTAAGGIWFASVEFPLWRDDLTVSIRESTTIHWQALSATGFFRPNEPSSNSLARGVIDAKHVQELSCCGRGETK